MRAMRRSWDLHLVQTISIPNVLLKSSDQEIYLDVFLGLSWSAGVGSTADVDIGEVQPFVVDGALATFCSGDSVRMKVNGKETVLTVTGVQIGCDCCNGAEFQITSQDFGLPIVFTWRQKLGRDVKLPDTIDLANPPDNWSYYLYAGCNPLSSACT
jgi:hypothetical protein